MRTQVVNTSELARAISKPEAIPKFHQALSGPDIWIDPRLYGSLFLSDRLVSALAEAKVEEAFGGLGGLRRCRIS